MISISELGIPYKDLSDKYDVNKTVGYLRNFISDINGQPLVIEIGPGNSLSPVLTSKYLKTNVLAFDISEFPYGDNNPITQGHYAAYYCKLPIDFIGNDFLYNIADRVQLVSPDSQFGNKNHINSLLVEASHICKPGGSIFITGDCYYVHSDNIYQWYKNLLSQHSNVWLALKKFSIDTSKLQATRQDLLKIGLGDSRMFDRYPDKDPGLILLNKPHV